MKRSLRVLASLVVLGAASASCGRVLNVVPHPQETNSWCWAASGQMVMHYLGSDTAQCTQANNRFGRTDCPCTQCSSPLSDPPCVLGGWPEFDKYGFTFERTTDTALSWSQLRSEIDHRRPVAFSWHWSDDQGGGHMMVATGYRRVAGTNFVWVRDPWPPCSGDYRIVTYEAYVSGSYYTHWDDFYGIRH